MDSIPYDDLSEVKPDVLPEPDYESFNTEPFNIETMDAEEYNLEPHVSKLEESGELNDVTPLEEPELQDTKPDYSFHWDGTPTHDVTLDDPEDPAVYVKKLTRHR